jgi:cyanophycin synthetase
LRGGPLDGSIITLQGDTGEEIITIKDMPSAHGGLLEVNIANAMAATGLAISLGIGKDAIASALRRFGLDPADNPGRMSRLTTTTGEIVVNYASNPVAVMTTLPAIDALTHIGTRFCIVTAPDNRPDDHFNAMAEALHGHFDWYIMFEIGKFIRRRTPGWVPQTIAGHFRDLGVPADRIMTPGDLKSAMQRVFEMTQAGDLVVILGATMYEVEETMAGLGMSPDGTVRRKR